MKTFSEKVQTFIDEEVAKAVEHMARRIFADQRSSYNWLQYNDITKEEMEQFPAAKEAWKIQNSPLYKALK